MIPALLQPLPITNPKEFIVCMLAWMEDVSVSVSELGENERVEGHLDPQDEVQQA